MIFFIALAVDDFERSAGWVSRAGQRLCGAASVCAW
jgi:hypothetical protein